MKMQEMWLGRANLSLSIPATNTNWLTGALLSTVELYSDDLTHFLDKLHKHSSPAKLTHDKVFVPFNVISKCALKAK